MSERSIDEILSDYSSKNLIAFPDVVRDMNKKIREISTDIPSDSVLENIALLEVWPLVVKHHLMRQGLRRDLKKSEYAKAERLSLKYESLASSGEIDTALRDLETAELRYLNPNSVPRRELLGIVVSRMCSPLEKHIRHTHRSGDKIIDDALMGGTIYLVGDIMEEEDPRRTGIPATPDDPDDPVFGYPDYTFFSRSFVCMDKEGDPMLFMDNIEGGDPSFKRMSDWEDRVGELYIALATTMYIAEQLGLKAIIPRDFELSELSRRRLGLRERRVFSRAQKHWKIGLHSEKAKTGIYVHSMYRASGENRNGDRQYRHNILVPSQAGNPVNWLTELEKTAQEVVQTNEGRRKTHPRTFRLLHVMESLACLIKNYRFSKDVDRYKAKAVLKYAYDNIPGDMAPNVQF